MIEERFDHALDDCITRITLYGASVEQCLAKYPDLAQELETELRVVAHASVALRPAPNADATARGRQRLQAEMVTYQNVNGHVPATERWWLWKHQVLLQTPRMAVAAASLAMVLVGVGTVSASERSVPGGFLYPVKHSVEETRLAFAHSETGKAELHLTFAERRAEELNTLIERGNTPQISGAVEQLNSHVASATAIAQATQSTDTAEAIRARLEPTASNALATLQSALQSASPEVHLAASKAFASTSETFGAAVEAMTPVAIAPASMVAASGIIQIRVTDPPPPDADAVIIHVGKIEARLAGSGEKWVTLSSEPQTFDLVRVVDLPKFLGEQEVRASIYTKVRLDISRAEVINNGVVYQVNVPSNSISLTRPFQVAEGSTTVLMLDFDGSRTLQSRGNNEFTLAPTVHVFAQEPNAGAFVNRQAPTKEDGKQPEKRNDPTFKSKTEIEGRVQEIGNGEVKIQGKWIPIPENTSSRGLIVGQEVHIIVTPQAGGAFAVTEAASQPKPANTPSSDKKNGGGSQDSNPSKSNEKRDDSQQNKNNGDTQREKKVDGGSSLGNTIPPSTTTVELTPPVTGGTPVSGKDLETDGKKGDSSPRGNSTEKNDASQTQRDTNPSFSLDTSVSVNTGTVGDAGTSESGKNSSSGSQGSGNQGSNDNNGKSDDKGGKKN